MIKHFADYLVEISLESYRLLLDQKYLIKSTKGSQTARYVIIDVDLLDPIRYTYIWRPIFVDI